MASKEERQQDSDYQEWLEKADARDTKLNDEWYHTPDDKRSDFIKAHKSWWKNF